MKRWRDDGLMTKTCRQ